MNEKLSRIARTVSLFCLSAAFILSPLFFLPLTTDFFQLNKQLFFTVLTAIALISWLVYNVIQKTVRLTLSPILLPLFIFTTIGITSTLINSPQNPEGWLTRPALFVVILVYFVLTTSLIQNSQSVRKILNLLLVSASLAAILGTLSILGAFQSLPASYLTTKTFSPTGSPLSLVTFLLTLLPFSLTLAFKVTGGPKKLVYFLTSGILISSIILIGSQLLPNRPLNPLLLPKLASWSIAIDTLKSKAFFGAGPNEFLNQFTQFKPISLNRTPLWTVNFNASGSEYLHILTTMGLIGLAAIGLIILSWYKLVKRDAGTRITSVQLGLNLATITLLIIGLFIPFTVFHWLILAGYLSLSVGLNKAKNLTKVKDVAVTLNTFTIVPPFADNPVTSASFASNVLPIIIGVVVLAGTAVAGYQVGRVYASELFFQQSLVAANNNLGTQTYNLQIKTINLSPNIDRYHLAYSNTNLALASALAAKANLTDQDKQTVTQLIQQSIREARTSVQLQPNKSANWQNLAALYRQLVNFAQGADQFSIDAYTQAVMLDPANPGLRLEMGGLYYSLGKFDQAVTRFQETIQLKPDMPNAYYNLSHAYLSQKKYLEAYQAMQQVEALIPADSADATTVKTELADLKTKLPATTTQPQTTNAQTQTLTQPSPAPAAPKNFAPVNVEPAPSPTQ
ncbi:MAG: tetratricopeptide repeat protein [Candidatus Beckwithbacteria bacterium]|nr:tetratricopeptide repeat protein [Candidatus Beckwithbacteria bacterium]